MIKEANNKVKRAIWEQRNNDLVRLAEIKGWIAFPKEPTNCFPGLSMRLTRILRRLRTGSCLYKIFPHQCDCGHYFDLDDIFSNCPMMTTSFAQVHQYKTTHNISIKDFLTEHNKLKWMPAQVLCGEIHESLLSHVI